MADNKYISLKVCGNQYANSGFMPLISFNSPTFEVTDSEYSGFNSNSYFISVKIEMSQVVYTLVKTNVRSCNGALREGSLKIAISVPKGYRISGGITPYQVLMKIKDFFMSSCMTCKDSVNGIYEFNSGIINPAILDDLAREFPLETFAGPYHPMTAGAPKGYITISEESMNLLFNDIQYAEFSVYSEVIVAQTVKDTNYNPIMNLPIPRVSRFRVMIDGVEDGYIDDPSEVFDIKGRKDQKYYDNKVISLSISDLRNGKVFPFVHLDEENEILSISTAALSVEKFEKVAIVFDQEATGYFLTFSKYFKLLHGQREIHVNADYTFTLKGEDLAILNAPAMFKAIFSQNDKYSIVGTELMKNAKGEYELKVQTQKVVVQPVPQSQFQPAPKSQVRQEPKVKESEVYKVEIILAARPEREFVTIYSNSKKVQSSKVRYFVTGQENEYRGLVYIPKTYDLSSLEIAYESDDCVFRSRVTYNARTDVYSASQFVAKLKSFYDKYIRPRKALLATVIGLISGLLLGGLLTCWLYPVIQKAFADSEIQCEYCTATFTDNVKYDEHLNSEHPFKCEYSGCSKRFDNEDALKNHVNEAHLQYECEHCADRFHSDQDLNDHVNRMHRFECEQCHQIFTTRGALTDHTNKSHKAATTQTPPAAKQYKCLKPDCGKTFPSEDDLYEHLKKAHNRYACPKCGQNMYFDDPRDLNNHMKRQHTQEEQ